MSENVVKTTAAERVGNVFGWLGDGMLFISIVGGVFAGAAVGYNNFKDVTRVSPEMADDAIVSATGLGILCTGGIIVAAVTLIWLPCRAMKYIFSGK